MPYQHPVAGSSANKETLSGLDSHVTSSFQVIENMYLNEHLKTQEIVSSYNSVSLCQSSFKLWYTRYTVADKDKLAATDITTEYIWDNRLHYHHNRLTKILHF